MLDKLKILENSLEDGSIQEWLQAFIAYHLGFTSKDIDFKALDAIDKALEYYYENDDATFLSQDLMDEVMKEDMSEND